jgi:hypothetical protein
MHPKHLFAAVLLLQGMTLQAQLLEFAPTKFTAMQAELNGSKITVRAFEKLVYVGHPVDTAYQVMNIYVPEAYFNGGSINGYTASTAPIFFPNRVGGFMPARPASLSSPSEGRPQMGNESTLLVALSKGYVVASAGARGRTTQNEKGMYTGKAPAALVDLKAAIRYLKFNDQKMPGDANKIIPNGTSAGGAMSVLLGATGNHPDYEPYLKELGAANAKDDIFAVSAYCPIVNLDHADMAYEWQFNGINEYQKRRRGGPDQQAQQPEPVYTLSEEQVRVSQQLKTQFPAYLNSLQLKDKSGKLLVLDENGNGSFKELVKQYLIASAQKALEAGTNLSGLSWLDISGGKVTALDWDAYLRYLQRMKTPPAFDALDLSSPENQEFGTSTIDKQHFTAYASQHSTGKAGMAEARIVKMMNPMYYIGNSKTSAHWRIRHGSKDKDTSLAIPVMLGTYLENKGMAVSLELPWDRPHSGDYDLTELFDWMDGICK